MLKEWTAVTYFTIGLKLFGRMKRLHRKPRRSTSSHEDNFVVNSLGKLNELQYADYNAQLCVIERVIFYWSNMIEELDPRRIQLLMFKGALIIPVLKQQTVYLVRAFVLSKVSI